MCEFLREGEHSFSEQEPSLSSKHRYKIGDLGQYPMFQSFVFITVPEPAKGLRQSWSWKLSTGILNPLAKL